jgi:two-component system phosphate regulon sensor histidine kinase PhoR
MFWRMAIPFSVLVASALAAAGLLAAVFIHEADRQWYLWSLLGVVALLSAVLVCVLSARFARSLAPLRDLTKAAERLREGASGERVFAEDGVVGPLAHAFNRMSEQLAVRITTLEEDRQQLRAILSGMVEGVVAIDADQRILFANDRALELLEAPTAPAVGRRLWEVVRRRPLLDLVERSLRQAAPCREELPAEAGAAHSLAVHVARLSDAASRGAVLVLHDTTELRRLERLRQEFVANVSHELKTPLTGIRLSAETLLAGAVDDAEVRGRFLEQIVAQTERLHLLILDLLSLARIESGAEQFEFEVVPLAGVVQACLERRRPQAEAKRQTLEATPADPDAAVWADEEAVEHILDNLVDNAVKYTPEGGHIRVGWGEAQGENEGAGQVWLQVTDDGIGIPEADLPRVFERFYRVDRTRSRQLGGTGLGLAIVKHLTQAMKGVVHASSRVGGGATFVVRLPRANGAHG